MKNGRCLLLLWFCDLSIIGFSVEGCESPSFSLPSKSFYFSDLRLISIKHDGLGICMVLGQDA
jgi:hypothetical protein